MDAVPDVWKPLQLLPHPWEAAANEAEGSQIAGAGVVGALEAQSAKMEFKGVVEGFGTFIGN